MFFLPKSYYNKFMKKILCGAIFLLGLGACYTPLNNSGVATTKKWLDISGKKTDFEGKQYDSCYQFNLRFWPQDAADALDLRASCVSACCWRSDKEEVTLDFNKNFERDLAYYGRAKKFTPGKITLRVNHSNLLNTTKVSADPRGSITSDGLVKLKYKEYENPARLAQIAAEARKLQTRRNAELTERRQQQSFADSQKETVYRMSAAKNLVLRRAGNKIDAYFYQMDKANKKQGKIFLVSERILTPRPANSPDAYFVSCHAKTKTGTTAQTLKSKNTGCGVWLVNVEEETVSPASKLAERIYGK